MSQPVLPAKLDLARTPTPFHALDTLSARLGGPRLWVKRDDLTECASTGNKIRKLEYTLARARESGCDTLITSGGLQSNHCRATALLGARLGFKVHLLLRDEGNFDEVPDGNLMLDYLAGAEISIYPKSRFFTEHAELLEHWRRHYIDEGRTPWVIPVGASDGHGVWGYVGCARELADDFARARIAPEVLFHATGSGGTQAGLTAGARLYNLPCRVVGMAVCDNEAYFQKKVRSDLRHWQSRYDPDVDVESLTIEVNDHYIGPGYGVATEEIFETIRLVAETEGLVLDPVYSAKAFHGIIGEIRAGRLARGKDVVFVHTGGIFGLMAQRDNLGITRPSREL
jgi:D-cysteine desulfhydrase